MHMTFEESMVKCNTGMDSSERWAVIKKAYDDYYVNYEGDRTPKIPKILHQIWIGSPLPDKYKILTNRWKAMHPDWTFILWDEQKIEEFELTNKWMYENSNNPAAKSDIARYEIAYSYGGIYIDTDFICCKNFDDLLYLDFFSGTGGSYDGSSIPVNLLQGMFGCSQGNKLIANIIGNLGRQSNIPHSITDIMQITGPDMFTQEILKELDEYPMSVIFPPNYFYPFPGKGRESIRNMRFEDMQKALSIYQYPETYAIHLWYCSWQKEHLL